MKSRSLLARERRQQDIAKSVHRKIIEKGAAALNTFTEEENAYYKKELAPLINSGHIRLFPKAVETCTCPGDVLPIRATCPLHGDRRPILDNNAPCPECGITTEFLREAESMIGSPSTEMFMDGVPEHRRTWLKKVRKMLTDVGVEPENLKGPWHT